MADTSHNTLKVQKIENGTVIDHISAGKAWEVVRLLHLDESPDTVTLLSRVHSKTLGKKDVVKVEHRQLGKSEVNKIALVSPSASVNLIKNYDVKEKYKVKLPKEVKGILKCTNPVCVTHSEPVESNFLVEDESPLKLRCAYCERVQSKLEFA